MIGDRRLLCVVFSKMNQSLARLIAAEVFKLAILVLYEICCNHSYRSIFTITLYLKLSLANYGLATT